MGVNLSDIVPVSEIQMDGLAGKTLAIDAYNSIYQFLSMIRERDGSPLTDSQGRVTSHLSGLFYRNVNFLEAGILPSYVFDGRPPALKARTLAERAVRRTKAKDEWAQAASEGDVERARSKASQTSRVTNEIIDSARLLLTHMGIPVVQAPQEGEAQAAAMAAQGRVWAACSQDYDSLLFGAPRLVRNLNTTGRRRMPGGAYRDVAIELVELPQMLEANGLASVEQLVDLCMMIGTDYNPGIRGIGPKKGLKLIREHGSLEASLEAIGEAIPDKDEVRSLFLKPERMDVPELTWRAPDRDKVIELMCRDYGFSESRVSSSLDRLEGRKARPKKAAPASPPPPGAQSSLDKFF